jgi:hypothetical protein
VGERLPPVDADDGTVVYGYLGMRPIVGRVSAGQARWSGTFRFLGQRAPFTVGGPVRPHEGEAEEDQSSYDGRVHHQYLDCELDVGGSGVTGSLVASCLDEGEVLEVQGSFSPASPKGTTSPPGDEPFYARTPLSSAPDPSPYYVALAGTPTEAHECAPFVELVESTPRPPGRLALLYTLRWPCEEGKTDGMIYPGMQRKPPAVTWGAYVADVTLDEPPKLLSSAFWAPLGDPDDPNDLTMTLRAYDLVPGVELYFATLSDQFQSPVSSGGSYSVSTVVWAVASDGRYGATTKLPDVQSGHAGVCYSSSSSRDLWLVDLEGDATPELVSRTVSEEVGDRIVNGKHECATVAAKTTFASYSLDPKSLTWQSRPAPKTLRERQLAAGRKLDVP